uniref:Bifunctional polynucleotide phosphatase/kinase n=1 Tax=Plectus sambesii TaxID=2011161 RepID=A0A914VYX0_9BILA
MSKRKVTKKDDSESNSKQAKLDFDTKPKGTWMTIGNDDLYIYTPNEVVHRSKVAGFDIDGTIIKTKSGRTFAKDENDWELLFPEIPAKIRQLHEDDYKIVFFTNQAGISKGKTPLPAFKRKVEAICSKLPVPIQVFVSPGTLKYRKPYVGMWEHMETEGNGGVPVDRSKSVYVGDAGGRAANGARKKDFSCGDRMFALNLEVKFATPEEFFLNKPAEPFTRPVFDSRKLLDTPSEMFDPATTVMPSNKQEVVVMVGFPGSGKSTWAERYLSKGYVIVNRDTLKTWQKCVEVAKKALKEGKSVIVDNTNPDKESRKRYVDMAKESKVDCRCFVMTCDYDQALHHVKFRNIMGTDKEHKDVNEMVLRMHKSKVQEPTLAEGFSEIVKVNFVPNFKAGSDAQKIFRMVLVEK